MMKTRLLILAVVVAVAAIFLLLPGSSQRRVLRIGDVLVPVELADTSAELQLGLSGRDSLPAGGGMLFIMPASARHGFWMKDMNFSLDLIWIDENWKVVQVMPDVPPESYPHVFQPDIPVRYVLEVNAGWAKDNNIAPGASVELQ